MVITVRYVAKKKVVSNVVKTAILYPGLCIEYMIYDIYWLVVWNIFHILEISSSQLTSIFFRGVGQPPNSIYIYRFVVPSAFLIKHSHSMINIHGITQNIF